MVRSLAYRTFQLRSSVAASEPGRGARPDRERELRSLLAKHSPAALAEREAREARQRTTFEEVEAECSVIFDTIDANSDGRISKAEFIKAVRRNSAVGKHFDLPGKVILGCK